MAWNISGWSQGKARTPLTYNLRAGQFRGMGRARYIPSTTIINNNIFGNMRSGSCCDPYSSFYNTGCCGGEDSTPKWMQWMMGIGMGTSLLGNIFDMFGWGKSKETDGAGAPDDKKPAEDPNAKDWTEVQNLYKGKGTFAHIADEYICLLSNGTKLTASSPKDLMGMLDLELAKSKTAVTTVGTQTITPVDSQAVGTKESFYELFSSSYVNANYVPAKGLKVGNVHYTNVSDAYKAYAGTSGAVKVSDISTSIMITDVIDNSDNIGDFTNLNKTINKSDLVKDNVITIGTRNYKVQLTASNYVILKDNNSSSNQTYILELKSDGKYQLHQRENAAVDGYGTAATS